MILTGAVVETKLWINRKLMLAKADMAMISI